MSEHTCPMHDYIPCVDVRAGTIMWPGRLLAEPRFPFYCTIAEAVEWFTAQEAENMGLVKVAYVHI
jgi:hypothetical protein